MNYIDLSKKIDAYTIAIYETLVSSAASLGVKFLVVGATSRDLILELAYNLRPYRATEDIDLGVRVDGWDQFNELRNTLLRSGKFKPTSSLMRLKYEGTHPIDILPFGKICEPENIVNWPPDGDMQLNVAGFKEAFENSIEVKLRDHPTLVIQVASLPNQMVLKLLAWNDRGMTDERDAKDIAIIISSYGSVVNEDRLYGEKFDIMTMEDFDIDFAGARLLGHDIVKVSSPELLSRVKLILENETEDQEHYRLAGAMTKSLSIFETDFEKNLNFLIKLKNGLEDNNI